MADHGKRPMNPCEDTPSAHKKRISDPAQDRLNLQPPPAFRQPTRPNVDKGKRPMHPSEEPSNQKRRIYIPPKDRLILQPPRAFQHPTDYIPPSLLPSSGAQILTKRMMAQRVRREREKHLKQNDNSRRLNAHSTTPGLHVLQQLSGSAVNILPQNLRTPPQAVSRPTQHTPITPIVGFEQLTSSESLQSVVRQLNPVRLFTDVLPPRAQTDSAMDQQNASICRPESSTSSLLHAIHGASTSNHENASQQPLQDTGQYDRNDDMTDDEDDIPPSNVPNRPIEQGRHSLGEMNVQCPFCKALHWEDERLSRSSLANPRFGTCCLQGKIKMPPLQTLLAALKALYEGDDRKSKSFQKHMRQYNQAFAFTSLGVDERVFVGRGPRPFTIHGELRHRTGALIPDPGRQATYSQLYIYDPSAALGVRQLRNPNLDVDVLRILHKNMLQYNCFSDTFIHAYEVLRSASVGNDENNNIHAYLHYSATTDRRRYNLPSADEIAVILPGDGSERDSMRDIVIYLKGGTEFVRISECHPAYLPLHYVLMFPHGELGWTPDLRRWDSSTSTTTNERLTQMDFYSYLLFQRHTEYSAILRGKKLFQEFVVDAWAATEQNRLRYYRFRQDILRAELYQNLTDVPVETLNPDQVGRRIVLPTSYIGSPRHMFEIFQDSMAITRYNKHPDIFLTMTANPQWEEVIKALLKNQTPTDRPEVVARVFELKRRALMREIKENGVLGIAVAHVYTIEFQKRGLPHMHALIYLRHEDKIREPAQVDRIVCAEFPDPETEPELFRTVIKCMVHGPCGLNNPSCPCMVNGRCKNQYPRAFEDVTTMDQNGYPIYRRRDTGRKYYVRGHEVDNRDVVPYNPYLSKMFDCHINVEVCAGIRCVKYIHKYIFKGHDRTTIVVNALDEIQQYLDARYIGPPEAVWRLLGFSLHQERPSVVRLALHLPGMHRVVYDPNESMDAILLRGQQQKSTLTGFFEQCALDPDARKLTYQEFPEFYVWSKRWHIWTLRSQGYAIGRMYFASPNSGERFYLRLLLSVVKGPQSFDDLKRVGNGPTLSTFKEACVMRGLLEDDREWVQCLQEAAIMQTGYQLRRLFCIILTECNPVQPESLWSDFSESICDLLHKLQTMFLIPHPTDEQVRDYGLFLLNEILFESGGKTLANFPTMPQPVTNWSLVVGNLLIWEQRQFQFDPHNDEAHANA